MKSSYSYSCHAVQPPQTFANVVHFIPFANECHHHRPSSSTTASPYYLPQQESCRTWMNERRDSSYTAVAAQKYSASPTTIISNLSTVGTILICL
mmetsp:Transcript_6501/g.14352  ORF Transcript_6501/g.14352 Transcript_6501/m.14352 type:complete len:95 (-) Transcript_6501:605-889(-)